MRLFKYLGIISGSLIIHSSCQEQEGKHEHPNFILLMADDLGWGDVGFNGNTIIKTPGLDRLASSGVILERFYSAAPVCSPSRGSCITGRNPFRYGIYWANEGYMKKEELTIAEILREHGYTTGHFGKWHLGSLSDSLPDSRRGGKGTTFFSPPWENGFDVCFSTEAAVATWNPTLSNDSSISSNASRYWNGYHDFETENLEGDDSRVMMDRVIPFIRIAVENKQAFLAVVWFHTPHSPVVAGEAYKKMYAGYDDDKQHYFGCITAMDEQIERLQDELKHLGIANNTMITFASDNGPAGEGGGVKQHPGGRQQGVTGGFRGRKGSLYEGGVRVPALISWPEKLKGGTSSSFPMVTSSYFTTILSVLGIELPSRPYDGIDILPVLQGKIQNFPGYIGFQSPTHASLVSDQYKLLVINANTQEHKVLKGEPAPLKKYELYDLLNDKFETKDISAENPGIVTSMNEILTKWIRSCIKSNEGLDYTD